MRTSTVRTKPEQTRFEATKELACGKCHCYYEASGCACQQQKDNTANGTADGTADGNDNNTYCQVCNHLCHNDEVACEKCLREFQEEKRLASEWRC